MNSLRRVVYITAGLLVGITTHLRAQQAGQSVRDTIRGTVRSTAGIVIGADVLVTPIGSRETWHGVTSPVGEFVISVPASAGGYLVVISAPGFKQSRLTLTQTATVALVDVTLLPQPLIALRPVQVRAHRRRPPPRRDGMGADYAGASNRSSLIRGLSGDVTGDLNVLAATIPGISLTRDATGAPSGVSVLGLSSDQNNTLLNGIVVSTGDLPRNAGVSTQVVTTIYDPSRGGFSGGQLGIHASPGSQFATRSVHLTVDAPALQASDAIASGLGQQFSDVQLSGSAAGPVRDGRLLYNAAVQVGHRTSYAPNLQSRGSLGALGVSPETSAALLASTAANGIPIDREAAIDGSNASAIVRIDHNSGNVQNANVVATARIRETRGAYGSPFAPAGYGAAIRSEGATVIGTISSYIRTVVLNEIRVAGSWSSDHSRSLLPLPEAQVSAPGGAHKAESNGLVTFHIGGIGYLPFGSRTLAGEIVDELGWQSVDSRHRVRITGSARLERLQLDATDQSLGIYSFSSLGDFDANRPALFRRTFSEALAPIHVITGSASIGDVWQPTSQFIIQYGLRSDVARYRTSASVSPIVTEGFNVSGWAGPQFLAWSPRLGMSYTYGQTSKLAGMGDQTKGTLTAGVGAFHDIPTSALLAPAVIAAAGARSLVCAGDAAGRPDWRAFLTGAESVPDQCAPGFPALSDASPDAAFISSGFRAPVSWRANVGWDVNLTSQLRAHAEAVYSLTRNLPDPINLNFANQPAFRLPSENIRPVFVPLTSIDPRTGSLTSKSARLIPDLGSVDAVRSDLQARSRQVTVTVAGTLLGPFDGTLNYTYGRSRSQQRGFSSTTSSSPNEVVWGRTANDARHQVNVTGSLWLSRYATLSFWGRLTSGLPFTPVTSSDINGDGLTNDQAYIPDPSQITDSSDGRGSAGIGSLLNHAPEYARACLLAQRSRVASRSSCVGPWASVLNAQLSLRPGFFGYSRIAVDMSIINLPAALDQIFHGNAPRGWGQNAFVDPVLLNVVGFDPAMQAFKYSVNPNFGRTLTSKTGLRAPFRVTLGVRIALGPSHNEQLLSRETKLATHSVTSPSSVETIREDLEQTFPNVVRSVIAVKDSIRLSPTQVDSLWALDRLYVTASDSIWMPAAQYLAIIGSPGYDRDRAMGKLQTAQHAAADLAVRMALLIKQVITREQLASFPPLFAVLLDERRVRGVLLESFF